MTEVVLYEASDGLATITLNRPERLNAMNREMVEALLQTVERAATDETVRVVLLTGAGRAFSAGGDRAEPMDDSIMRHGDHEIDASELRRVARTAELLHEMPKVTIAAINGACVGAGLALACAADLRVSSTSAVFATAFVPAALPGDFGGTWTLPRIVGDAKARELYLLGERFAAEEALHIGLVSRVVDPAELATEVDSIVARLLQSAPIALALAKANLNDAASLGFADLIEAEARRTVECVRSDDAAEARAAFGEGRPPVYDGARGSR